jgi:hypothetical protein
MIWEKYIAVRETGIEELNEPQWKWLLTIRHIVDINIEKGHVFGEIGRNAMREGAVQLS